MSMDFQPSLEKVMDLLVDTICVVDSEGRFVFASAACERLLGYTREELIGRNMIELVYPEDRERTLLATAEIMSGLPKIHFENRYVRKDGKIVDIMWSARWVEKDGLRMAVARDITEIKHATRSKDALYRISEAAHTADGLPALCEKIHRIIAELLHAENFFVALYNKESNILSFPYYFDRYKQAPEAGLLKPDTLLGEVICSERSQLHIDSCQPSDSRYHYAGWLGVPLISDNEIIGAVVIRSYPGETGYADNDRNLLEFVSVQITDAIQRKQMEIELRHMAWHDALTNLPNRILFQDRFDMAIRRARRQKEKLALLYLDLNNFKEINDTFGHETGDSLLRETACRLLQCVRDTDTTGRRGGDEFTLLLTNISGPQDIEPVLKKIRSAIGRPFRIDGRDLTISASIGVAVYPDDGTEKEQLFRHADASMYSVKQIQWRDVSIPGCTDNTPPTEKI